MAGERQRERAVRGEGAWVIQAPPPLLLFSFCCFEKDFMVLILKLVALCMVGKCFYPQVSPTSSIIFTLIEQTEAGLL